MHKYLGPSGEVIRGQATLINGVLNQCDVAIGSVTECVPEFYDRAHTVVILRSIISVSHPARCIYPNTKSGDLEMTIRFPTRDFVPSATDLCDTANEELDMSGLRIVCPIFTIEICSKCEYARNEPSTILIFNPTSKSSKVEPTHRPALSEISRSKSFRQSQQ